MNHLQLQIKRKPNPYCSGEDWGEIELSVVGPDGRGLFTLINMEWDPSALVDWLLDCKHELLTGVMPAPECGNSISEAVAVFYDKVDPEDDSAVDGMHQYRSRHCLRFAMRGADMPEYYLGLFKNRYEVSGSEAGTHWRYDIDLEGFLRALVPAGTV